MPDERTVDIQNRQAHDTTLDLPIDQVPMALADLHRKLEAHGSAIVRLIWGETLSAGRSGELLEDICIGAGFSVDHLEVGPQSGPGKRSSVVLRLIRRHTLADTVGPDMKLLICGLNPSPLSADTGIGFARPGNRFWPAAIAAGLVTKDRDPRHALLHHGIGMTDLAKRQTRTAAELSRAEYTEGFARVERLIERMAPRAVCFVGLAGWRDAVDRKAVAGLQPRRVADRPVYLMPSTSGLNANSGLDDLTEHLRAALRIAESGN